MLGRQSECLNYKKEITQDDDLVRMCDMYLTILKEFDHYNQFSFDASNDIMSKNYLHSGPKCIFSGQKM